MAGFQAPRGGWFWALNDTRLAYECNPVLETGLPGSQSFADGVEIGFTPSNG
jgi:hypothetical protein